MSDNSASPQSPSVHQGPLAPEDYADAQVATLAPDDNPGLEEHIPRYTDVDKAAGDRAYRQVLAMLGVVPVLAIAFVVIYFAVDSTTVISFGPLNAWAQHLGLGLTGGLATLLIGLACIHWAKQIMNDTEVAEERHTLSSPDEDKQALAEQFAAGAEESGLGRRKLIGGALAGAIGMAVVPVVVVLADMGPHPGPGLRAATIEKTLWSEGVRLVNDVNKLPLRPEGIEIGQLVNGQPENLFDLHGTEYQQEKAKSGIVVVRMEPDRIKIPESRKDWHVGGILCYSKICTHVGCPISLWERTTHHLLCPCHQSTFDLGNSGVVVFGPAARSLPQLPIKVDAEGYLVAQADFAVPVGPSYFERDSRNDYKDGDN